MSNEADASAGESEGRGPPGSDQPPYYRNHNPEYVYNCEVQYIVDGDTYDVAIDLGFETHIIERVRLAGVDTAETYGVDEASEEYKRGKKQKEQVEAWLAQATQVDGDYNGFPLVLYSEEFEVGAYGRVIGDLYSRVTEEWLSTWCVENFEHVAYDT